MRDAPAFFSALHRAQHAVLRSASTFARDVGHGLLDISHNTLALVGLAAVGMLVLAIGRADLRGQVRSGRAGLAEGAP